ncbi:MAG: dihydrolipoyl dehydrogenase [Methylococcales bacterium]|nr:dihydrolipoyl dehydrogenase [Methylococcales bacterium]MBT7410272.1 dihydrolipoyl dehydrogenase [Methylococcales bacterium]
MSNSVDVLLPDIGDFNEVEVIEILVSAGDSIEKEDSLITLESDKATMEIPSPHSGTVEKLMINVGDKIAQDSLVLTMTVSDSTQQSTTTEKIKETPEETTSQTLESNSSNQAENHAEVLVIGGGPGGYTAAFRAADLGKKVILVERYPSLGGVCLNVGCIPSKALLHIAHIINESKAMADHGVTFAEPKIDLAKMRGWKEGVVNQLTSGLKQLSKQRKVKIVQGLAKFTTHHEVEIMGNEDIKSITFDHAIIAAGSEPTKVPVFPEDPRIIDSTGALDLTSVPNKMLIIGGGIIGLEMATVYNALGSNITVVELMDSLIPGCDKDLVRPLQKRISKQYENIFLKTKVSKMEALEDGIKVYFEGGKAPEFELFDCVLVAVGRRPNGKLIGAEAVGIEVNEQGFIKVDKTQRTQQNHIFAIGDIVGNPMLAHKAVYEGKIAAEVIADLPASNDALTIPSVAYTDPEIAWMGLTETDAKQQGIDYEKGVFPWAASGRSLSMGRSEGLTKLLFDKSSKRVLGAGIVGSNAGELIAEAVLALEMGADAEDIGLTIHPHPTLSETLCFSAEAAEGTITDLYMPKK